MLYININYFFIIIYMYIYSAYSTTVSYFAILHMHTRAYATMCRDYALLYLYNNIIYIYNAYLGYSWAVGRNKCW